MKIRSLFFSFLLFGCSEKEPEEGTYDHTLWQLRNNVVADDGISFEEAEIISWAFFLSGVSGCGAPDEPELINGEWVAKTYVGFAGKPGELIYINAETGQASTKNPPLSLSLKQLKGQKI